jgi:hypothetical protein
MCKYCHLNLVLKHKLLRLRNLWTERKLKLQTQLDQYQCTKKSIFWIDCVCVCVTFEKRKLCAFSNITTHTKNNRVANEGTLSTSKVKPSYRETMFARPPYRWLGWYVDGVLWQRQCDFNNPFSKSTRRTGRFVSQVVHGQIWLSKERRGMKKKRMLTLRAADISVRSVQIKIEHKIKHSICRQHFLDFVLILQYYIEYCPLSMV